MSGTPDNAQVVQWTMERKISVANILALILLVAGVFQWRGQVETRLSLVEQQQANQQQQFADKLDDIKETLTDLRAEVRRIRDTQQQGNQ